MMTHHAQFRKERVSLISGLLKKRSTTYPHLCLALRDLIMDEVFNDLKDDCFRLPQIVYTIRRRITFHPVARRAVYDRVAGVDAGSQRVPLASRWYAVIAALIFQLPNAKRFFTTPEAIKLPYSFSGEKFHEIVSLKRETKLFETSAKYLNNQGSVDLILVDGPLAFGNWWANKGEKQDRYALVSSINLLLNLCAEKGVAVAGVVKRATARYLINHLRLQQATSLSDAFILLQTLKPGERTDVFSPRDALKKNMRAAPFMDLIIPRIYSFYLRSSSNQLVPPIRVDIPEFMLNSVDTLASYCYSTAINDGIPLSLVKADEEVRVTKRFINEIYSELIHRFESHFGTSSPAAGIWGEFE